MRWLKVPQAAKEWAGDVNPKTVYGAIRAGRCKAARIGAGRNVLVCELYIDEWLGSSSREAAATAPIAMRPARPRRVG